jgi:hypothetical protein
LEQEMTTDPAVMTDGRRDAPRQALAALTALPRTMRRVTPTPRRGILRDLGAAVGGYILLVGIAAACILGWAALLAVPALAIVLSATAP